MVTRAAARRSCSPAPRLVVLTGGPSAEKTAVLDVVQRNFCHLAISPSFLVSASAWFSAQAAVASLQLAPID